MIRPKSAEINSRLGTLPEEQTIPTSRKLAGISSQSKGLLSVNNSSRTSPASTSKSPVMNRSRKNSNISSSSSSGNPKPVGLGLARRPSDNLLQLDDNNSDPLSAMQILASALPQPPRIDPGIRKERPISNDSIITTKSSEIFSTSPSDTNSNISVTTNDSDEASFSVDKSNELSSCATITDHSIGHRVRGQSFTMGENSRDSSFSKLPMNKTFSGTSTHYGNNTSRENNEHILPHHNNRFVNTNGRNHPPFLGNNTSIPNLRPGSDSGSYGMNNITVNPKLYNQSNSTSAVLPSPYMPSKLIMTPSQRYRMRKEQSEHALRDVIKRKEKLYEEQDGMVELQEGDVDGSFIFNVPMSSYSTTSFLTSTRGKEEKSNSNNSITEKSPSLKERPSRSNRESNTSFASTVSNGSALDFFEMPTSPIPGVNRMSDFQYLQETTKHLSSVYVHSSTKLSKSKLSERTASADCLPLEFKEASQNGMEDLLLVSENKIDAVSHTRPSWLPPKDPEEKKLHEREISKTLSMASLDQLERNRDRDSKLIVDETNKQKYVLLLDRDVTRKSSLQSLKKIVWETPIVADCRYSIYDQILQGPARLVTEKYLESFDEIISLSNRVEFTRTKEIEIKKLIQDNIEYKIGGKNGISEDLMLMLKLKSLSQQGILPGDEILFHHFLCDESFENLQQIWDIVNLIQMTCFNETTKEKFDKKIVDKSGLSGSYLLKDDSFKHEFNATCMNSNTWWNVLQRINHPLFMWIIDIIVTANAQSFKNNPIDKSKFESANWEAYKNSNVIINYQIMLSFALNILLNYHFGFNDLKSLADLPDANFCIPMSEDEYLDIDQINSLFINKWRHYYKKL
ncbi:Protein SBE2 [Nakaseomyces bracarensis]|uniref:Protein SBE2 n=1 Tax=Nakaseomyces bracarensis TaxID=273131 RepID=A0ABR4NXC5_9SACH